MTLSDFFEAAGLILVSVAAFMVSAALGAAVAGLALLLAGFALDRKGDA